MKDPFFVNNVTSTNIIMEKIKVQITRLEFLISTANETMESLYHLKLKGSFVNSELFAEFRSSSLSFLSNTFGFKHSYYLEFEKEVQKNTVDSVLYGKGILKGAKNEIENGWYFSTKTLISAEIFTDFLETAEYLLEEGYKDPAAVMIGSVLEQHLRKLCEINDIDYYNNKDGKQIPKRGESLNSELSSSNIYSKLDQKNVTAWFGLRNNAAHGNYSSYTKEQVRLMLEGVSNFILRTN